MKKSILLIATLIISILFSGCSVKSEIVKVSESKSHFEDAVYEGQDFYVSDKTTDAEQYRVFHQASSGFSGTGGIRSSAENRAKNFCKELDKNKEMLKLSEHTAKPPYIFGNFPRIEIIFACVEKENIATTTSKYNELSKIKALLENGTLTQVEFEVEKKKILK